MNYKELGTDAAKKKRNSDKLVFAGRCVKVAERLFAEGNYEEAIEEYGKAADAYETVGRTLDYAKVCRMMGEACTNLRMYDKAIALQNIHLNVAREQKDEPEEQRALATLGHTYLTRFLDGETCDPAILRSAYESFTKSMSVCESLTGISKTEHMDMKARLYSNLGLVQENLGNFDRGKRLMQKSIEICQTYDLFEQLERGYAAMASTCAKRGEHDGALRYLNLAMQVAARLDNKIALICTSLVAKAEIFIDLGDFQRAKAALLKAYKLRGPNADEREVVEKTLKIVAAMCLAQESLVVTCETDYGTRKRLYERLGDGACSLNRPSQAVEYYRQMLRAAERNGETGKDLSPCYVSLAETYRDVKRYDLATEYFRKEFDVCQGDPKEAASTLLNVADTMEAAGTHSVDDVSAIYREARNLIGGADLKLAKKISARHVGMLRRSGRENEAALSEREQQQHQLLAASQSDSEDENECSCTPNIGDEIRLDDLTDGSDDDDVVAEIVGDSDKKTRASRTQTKTFAIKRNQKGETQLHTACIKGDFALVARLLDRGHAVNVRDHCGWLPIHEAAISGHKEIVELLSSKGADVNDAGGTLCGGTTPLHDACVNGHLEIVKLLLDRGASPLMKNDRGETPYTTLLSWRKNSSSCDSQVEELYAGLAKRMKDTLEKVGQSTRALVDDTRERPELASSIIDDDDDDGESVNEETSESSNARDEYRQVMDTLRHRRRQTRQQHVEKKRKSTDGPPPRDPLLGPEDVDDSNWLQDDTGAGNKKRKTSVASKSQRKHHQVSLIESGFTRKNSFSSGSSTAPSCPVVVATASSSSSNEKEDDSAVTKVLINEPVLAIDVRIDGKLYRVPIRLTETHTRTVRWLADEASKRYSKKECSKPQLELETKNGALLAEDDFVSILFPAGSVQAEQVHAKIIKWNLPSLHERYKEACDSLNTEVDERLSEILRETTTRLDLGDRGLRSNRLAPICKALNRQANLNTLNLSGNFMGDEECVFYLASALTTLENLVRLDLSLVDLTCNGLASLERIFAENEPPPACKHLAHLDLGHNDLGNEALRSLAVVTRHRKLKSLHLSNVGFVGDPFVDRDDVQLHLDHLEELDLSHNRLDGAGFSKFFSWLEPESITGLNVASNFCANVTDEIVDLFSRSSSAVSNVKTLNVAANFVTDGQVFRLMSALETCDSFEALNLSDNSDLTWPSLRTILSQDKPFDTVDSYGCENLLVRFDAAPVERLARIKTFRISLLGSRQEDVLCSLTNMWTDTFGQSFRVKTVSGRFAEFTLPTTAPPSNE